MQIKKDTVVYVQYKMYDVGGELLDESDEPLAYLHGGYDGIFPQVEEALHGKAVGDTINVTMEPEFAFGEYDDSLIREESLKEFAKQLGVPAKDVELGLMVEAEDEEVGDVLVFTVTKIDGDKLTLDGNHPLAGKTLRFEGKVVDVREATADELSHGHAHDGHDHD